MREIRNLILNPKPSSMAGWMRFGDCDVHMVEAGDAICVRNNSGGGGRGIDLSMPSIPAGEYVAACSSDFAEYERDETVLLIKKNEKYIAVNRFDGSHEYIASFVLADPGCNIIITPPAAQGAAVNVKRFLMCTKEDWEQMQALHVAWFDGDGIVPGGGLPPSVFHPYVDRCALVVVA